MTLKQHRTDIDKLDKTVASLKRTISELKDELAMQKSNHEDFRRMVSLDMKKIVDQLNK